AIEAAPNTPSGDARPRICRVGAISTLPAPRPTAAAPTAPARRTLRRETPLLLAVSRLSSTTSVIRPTSSWVEQCTRPAPCRARLSLDLRSHSGFSQSPRAAGPARELGRTHSCGRTAIAVRRHGEASVWFGTPLVAAVVRAARTDDRLAGSGLGQVGTT